MEKEFVTYEIALKLKELGFDEECLMLWEHTDFWTNLIRPEEFKKIVSERYCKAPLWHQAFRWFREKYGLWFRPDYYDEMKEYNFQGSIHKLGKYSAITNIDNYKTPEEAELACLKKLIEMVKKK